MVLLTGDCRALMAEMDPASVDAIVTDPPYELAFMGKSWDRSGVAFAPETWAACLRVMKPGGYLLAFGGTRLFHRMTVAIEDAGFEIRDCLSWLYGSGFPKALDVSKAIDKAAGAEREVVGTKLGRPGMAKDGSNQRSGFDHAFGGELSGPMSTDITAPATHEAERWQGWGTALKPGWEPIIMARKPLIGTVAANVLAHGTGAINVDATRIAYVNETPPDLEHWKKTSGGWKNTSTAGVVPNDNTKGRWPANVCLDEDAAALLDAQSGRLTSGRLDRSKITAQNKTYGNAPIERTGTYEPSSGGASRFMKVVSPDLPIDSGDEMRFRYCAKSSRSERNKGLDGMPEIERRSYEGGPIVSAIREPGGRPLPAANHHPTVKPVSLMQWLVRMVTPPGGIVLDPFMGSGSTGVAADREGFQFIGMEMNPEYVEIAERRIYGDAPLFVGAAD